MMPRYVEALLEGGLHPNRQVEVKLDGGALLALDGCAGYGQSIGLQATRHGDRARAQARHVRSSRSATRTTSAASATGPRWRSPQGLVSLHFVNVQSFARVAPFAGADRRFGTNPVCIGIPLPGEPPFLLDMATSAVAQGKLRVAHNKRAKIPLGWLIDDQGNPTDDPRWGVVQPLGAMAAFGEHKGYGLAVACELLGGALTGGGVYRLRQQDPAARAERHALDRHRSGAPRHAAGVRARTRRASSPGCARRAPRPATTACASPASPSASTARSASATAFRWTRRPGRRSAPPRRS